MEKLIVVEIIQDENPICSLGVIEPIMEQFEDICREILPTRYFSSLGNLPAILLKASRITRMNPEDPCLRRLFSNSIAILYRELRFAFVIISHNVARLRSLILTPHHLDQPMLTGCLAESLFLVFDGAVFLDQRNLDRDETGRSREGAVGSLVGLKD